MSSNFREKNKICLSNQFPDLEATNVISFLYISFILGAHTHTHLSLTLCICMTIQTSYSVACFIYLTDL